jgi:hypothetical protein
VCHSDKDSPLEFCSCSAWTAVDRDASTPTALSKRHVRRGELIPSSAFAHSTGCQQPLTKPCGGADAIGGTCVDCEPLPAASGDRRSVERERICAQCHQDSKTLKMRLLLGSHTHGDEVLGIFPCHNAPDTRVKRRDNISRLAARSARAATQDAKTRSNTEGRSST